MTPLQPRSVGHCNNYGQQTKDSLVQSDASYICSSCGEEIVVPIDLSEGSEQEYVEDCPVCCCPNVIRVTIDDDGRASVESESA